MAEEKSNEKYLAEYLSRDGQSIKLSFEIVRRYLVSGKANLVTDQEILFYAGMCKARGLNPFKKDCYLVKYTEGDPAAIIVSIDYFRSRARAQEDCQGWKAGIIILDKNGQIVQRPGSFIIEGEKLLGGWFKARPASWLEDYEWSINVQPYIKKTREGSDTRFWREENQAYMIAKVAESQGLRRIWPDEFQGLYTEDELLPRDVTPEPLRMPSDTAAPLQQQGKGKKDEQQSASRAPNVDRETGGSTRVPARKSNEQADADMATPRNEEVAADAKATALAWIKEATRADWENAPKNWLENAIRGMNNRDQIEVCRAWNERNTAERTHGV